MFILSFLFVNTLSYETIASDTTLIASSLDSISRMYVFFPSKGFIHFKKSEKSRKVNDVVTPLNLYTVS